MVHFKVQVVSKYMGDLMTKNRNLWSKAVRDAYNHLRNKFGFGISDKTVSSRLGFMAGQIEVPDDFDDMGSSEIEKMFSGRRIQENRRSLSPE